MVALTISIAVIISGTLALNRVLIGRWSLFPLVAIPLLYNYVFLVGLNGGDAFTVRFVRMEVARLGMTVEDYFQSCRQAIAISDELASALRN